MKLNQEEMNQLRARNVALGSVQTLFEMAKRELSIFQNELLNKYGLDEKKPYRITNEGELLEIKEESIPDKKEEV